MLGSRGCVVVGVVSPLRGDGSPDPACFALRATFLTQRGASSGDVVLSRPHANVIHTRCRFTDQATPGLFAALDAAAQARASSYAATCFAQACSQASHKRAGVPHYLATPAIALVDVVITDMHPHALGSFVKSRRAWSLQDWASIGLDIVAGIQHLWTCGLVHCQLHPGNVMVAHDGRAIVAGLAGCVRTREGHTDLDGVDWLVQSSPEVRVIALPTGRWVCHCCAGIVCNAQMHMPPSLLLQLQHARRAGLDSVSVAGVPVWSVGVVLMTLLLHRSPQRKDLGTRLGTRGHPSFSRVRVLETKLTSFT